MLSHRAHPSPVLDHVVVCAQANSKAMGDFSTITTASAKMADHVCNVKVDLGFVIACSLEVVSVPATIINVVLSRIPSKITQVVVCAATITVACFHSGWAGTNKRFQHKTMDQPVLFPWSMGKDDGHVASTSGFVLPHNASFIVSPRAPWIAYITRQTLDSSKVGNLIQTLPSKDGSPFFDYALCNHARTPLRVGPEPRMGHNPVRGSHIINGIC